MKNETTMKLGDKVSAVMMTQKGESVHLSVIEGELVGMGVSFARIKKGRTLYVVKNDTLRPAGQKNALTEAMTAKFEGEK